MKVVLIIGIFGFLRLNEIDHFQYEDIKLNDDIYISSVLRAKRKGPKKNSEFVISGSNYCDVMTIYLNLFSEKSKGGKLIKSISKGMVIAQNMGRNTIGKIPSLIAQYLSLENPGEYTSHAIRRSAATLLAESGASIETLKRAGGWLSSSVAEGYVADSLKTKASIASGISCSSDEPASKRMKTASSFDSITMSNSSNYVNCMGATNCVVKIYCPTFHSEENEKECAEE
jgi:hypothetical protein